MQRKVSLGARTFTLTDIFSALWQGKWVLLCVPLLFAVVAFFVLRALPDVYRSEVLLAPTELNSSNMQLGQLGGIAALAGLQMGNQGSNLPRLAIDILQSRQFLTEFIEKYDPAVALIAATGWDRDSNQLLIDDEVYNTSTQQWVREVKAPKSVIPTQLEIYEELLKQLTINRNKETGMVVLSMQHYSPELAQQWLSWLVTDLNRFMKQRDIMQSQSSLKYLEQQLQTTQVEELRRAIYQLIEEQTKTLMLAQVSEEYVFHIIDPAFLPEKPVGPKRLLWFVVIVFVSGILTGFVILIRSFAKQDDR